MPNRNNPIYIGQTASYAAKSHGAAKSGGLRSSGGPHHPKAGAFEEPNTPNATRLSGVEKLGNQYPVKIDTDGDYDNGGKLNESDPYRMKPKSAAFYNQPVVDGAM